MKTILRSGKGLLMLSGTGLLLMITPAFLPRFLGCAGFILLLCLMVWKLPVSWQRPRPGVLGAALVLCSAMGVEFYNTWISSRMAAKCAQLLHLPVGALVTASALVLVALSLPAVSYALNYYGRRAVQDYTGRPCSGKFLSGGRLSFSAGWAVLMGLYTLGILAILRADFLYKDDLGRTAFGYKQWEYMSRYVSSGLSTLIHMGNYLTDEAPLTQLLAAAILALTGMIIEYILFDRREFSVLEVLAMLLLGLNPYFLECFSYRFDSPYMAISILAAVLPLLFYRGSPGAYVLGCMLGNVLVLTSYQPSTGVFPMLVILLALRLLQQGKGWAAAARLCLRSAVGYGLGGIFFWLVLLRPSDAGYVSTSLPAPGELLPTAVANLTKYYRLIFTDYKPLWLVLTAVLAVGFLWCGVRQAKLRPAPAAAAGVAALLLMGLLCFGLYPLLKPTLFSPRAMYGFGVATALLAAVVAEGRGNLGFKLAGLALCWAFFVFSFTYGDALSAQKEYTQFRMELVIQDLNDLEPMTTDQPVTVQISGSIGKAPVIQNMPDNYNVLDRLIPDTFGDWTDWSQIEFYIYYNLKNVVWNPDVDLRKQNLPVLRDTMYHTIRVEGDSVLIELK